jgi:hypothetical protein
MKVILRIIFYKALEFCYFRMEENTRVSGLKIKGTEKEFIHGQMGRSMKVSMLIMRDMVLENLLTKMEKYTLENGQWVNSME